jgi:nicotinamide-nucleotide amidase
MGSLGLERLVEVQDSAVTSFSPRAVSREVAMAMALGALQHSRAQVAVAVTGIAGPGGGTPAKPIGTVWFGFAIGQDFVQTEVMLFPGDRGQVRASTVKHALVRLLSLVSQR